jgi:transcriptional regulator with GAF, ATPase, and Fis domain
MSLEGPWFQSTHPNAPASVGHGPALELRIVHPPEVSALKFTLTSKLAFGRAPDEQLACVPHATISRRHAEVRIALGGVLCVEDLGSRNGTKVDGKPLTSLTPLGPQTVLRLGDVHAVVDEISERRFDESVVLPGTSPRVARASFRLAETARSTAPVLIMGETGTGKERLAEEVHRLSGRTGRYVTLNCAELSPQLIESQLFGHERGAFTGASAAKPGLFAAAHGGTLFLDEIGELALDLQPKLLRVLQEGEVRRVGSVEPEKVDVRVVAATNRDLPALVEQGSFRRDLLARLSFHELRLPPLRERRQDLLPWLSVLAAARAATHGGPGLIELAPDAVECVLLHAWADNLRGLDRLVHRLAGQATPISRRVLLEALPELRASVADDSSERVARGAFERHASSTPPRAEPGATPTREELLAVYEANGRSIRSTAKHFGKDRRQIYRWFERFEIPRDDGDE